MCDTWAATGDATRNGRVLFGKNSDRPIFDCQPLVQRPRRTWPPGSHVQLEYVTLPQAEITYATLGSGPYWCWGYEEGINEYGVAIGNEAIFTRTFREAARRYRSGTRVELGFLGMDLIRLALERSASAAEAVDVMGALVEEYGQFGSAMPTEDHVAGSYDNSFLIADPQEAWILEAVGRRWAARQVNSGTTSISNEPSIRTHWTRSSPDVAEYAVRQGWWPADRQEQMDFARAFADETVPRQVSHIRAKRSRQLLAEKEGQVTVPWMMRIARDHYEDTFLGGPYFDAADPDFLTICMHVSPANFTWGNTASSCVAVLSEPEEELPMFWWTPGPPCNGCYVPFFVHGSRLPETVTRAGTAGRQVIAPPDAEADSFSSGSYWWLFRQLLDTAKGTPVGSVPETFAHRNRMIRARFDLLEQSFAESLPQVMAEAREAGQGESWQAAQVLDDFSATCVQRVVATLHDLLAEWG